MFAASVALVEVILNILVEVAKKLLGLALIGFLSIAFIVTAIVLVVIAIVT
jgi:hypothetical protein